MTPPEPTVVPVRNVDAGPNRPLLLEAAHLVIGRRSVTKDTFQRRMRVGFVMTGRLLNLLEDAGVIGPAVSSGPRDVLVEVEQRDAVLAVLAKEDTSDLDA